LPAKATAANTRLEKLLRDARIYSIFEGTNQVKRQVIGKTLLG
jgi:Acyl-CoA dehydrogenases